VEYPSTTETETGRGTDRQADNQTDKVASSSSSLVDGGGGAADAKPNCDFEQRCLCRNQS